STTSPQSRAAAWGKYRGSRSRRSVLPIRASPGTRGGGERRGIRRNYHDCACFGARAEHTSGFAQSAGHVRAPWIFVLPSSGTPVYAVLQGGIGSAILANSVVQSRRNRAVARGRPERSFTGTHETHCGKSMFVLTDVSGWPAE